MYYSITFVLFFTSVCLVESQNTDHCSEERRNAANLCSDKLFFAGRNARLYPESNESLDKHCKETTDLINCVTHYTDNCRRVTRERSAANVMLSTIRHNQRNYCNRPHKRVELIELGVCANAIRDQSTVCTDTFLLDLGRASHTQKPHKIPHGCCAFHDLKKCVMSAAERMAANVCTQKRRQSLEKYIEAMASNSINMLCGQYDDDSDKCDRLPSLPTGNHISKAPTVFSGFTKLLH